MIKVCGVCDQLIWGKATKVRMKFSQFIKARLFSAHVGCAKRAIEQGTAQRA